MKQSFWPTLTLVACLPLMTACPGFGDKEPEAPENPNYEEHIAPIMEANCNKCHAASPANGAPDGFRLDVCEDTADDRGAQAQAARIVARILADTMPPASEGARPSPLDKATLENWQATGAPCKAGDQPDPDAGGQDTGEDVVVTPGRYTDEVVPVLESNGCLAQGCHAGDFVSGGLNLETEMGAMTTGNHAPVVVRCEPDDSYLVQKLRADTLTDGSSVMPLGGEPISDEDLDVIRGWIADGADTPGNCGGGGEDTGVEDTGVEDTGVEDTGGGQDADPDLPDDLNPSFAEVEQVLTENGCADQGCHGPEPNSGGLQLVPFAGLMAGGNSGPVVVPCEPDQSNLILKCRDNTVPFGSPMPLGRTPMPAEDLNLLRAWVADGANETFDPQACAPPEDQTPPLFEGPTGVDNLSAAGTECLIRWDAGFDETTAVGALRYRIYQGLTGDIDYSSGPLTEAGALEYRVTGLEENTAYEFDVRAVDEAGNESTLERIIACTPMSQ